MKIKESSTLFLVIEFAGRSIKLTKIKEVDRKIYFIALNI